MVTGFPLQNSSILQWNTLLLAFHIFLHAFSIPNHWFVDCHAGFLKLLIVTMSRVILYFVEIALCNLLNVLQASHLIFTVTFEDT